MLTQSREYKAPQETEPMKTLNILKSMMKITGTWPAKTPSLRYRILCCTSLLFLMLLMVTTTAKIFINLKDFETVSYGFSCSATALQTLLRQIVLFSKTSNFHNIFERINQSSFKKHKKNYEIFMTKKMKLCNKLRRLYVSSSMTAGALLAAAPVFNHLNRTLPIPFPVDMNEQPLIFYISVWCFQVIAACIVTWGSSCLDCLISTFMWIAVAQLEILKEEIAHATDALKFKSLLPENNSDFIVCQILKKCIAHHVAIERYLMSLEDTFSLGFLCQLLPSLFITGFIGFSLIVFPINSIQFGRSFFFFLAIMMELALFCIAGNELVIQSQKIQEACYITEWNYCDLQVRKMLMLMMERSKRPFFLTAGKFVPLNLQTLLSVWRTAFSYLTVLRRLYSNLK